MARPRPPTWLKRPLLPIWNGGHRLARTVGDHLDALVHRRFERCACCGTYAPMLYRRRVIPDRLAEVWGLSPKLAEALARKESLDCAACGAKLRGRRMAEVVMDLYPVDGSSGPTPHPNPPSFPRSAWERLRGRSASSSISLAGRGRGAAAERSHAERSHAERGNEGEIPPPLRGRVGWGVSPASPPMSLRMWAKHPNTQPLRVAELNRIDGVHQALANLPNLSFSDFQPNVQRGSYADGVRNEDLVALTYPDASFDLVLTSETLEHVPDLAAALGEIFRVLVPGGRHVFTVPILPGVAKTFARAVRDPYGNIHHLATPISHPGGDSGYPVFTEFGADLPEILREAGFEVDVRFGPTTEDDLAQVFICRKPDGESGL
jgi:SAM-dependent methyltransferase